MRRSILVVVVLAAALLAAIPASARQAVSVSSDADRAKAMALYDDGNLIDAFPLLEKLAADRPNDVVVQERLGMCLVNVAGTFKDPDESRKRLLRARAQYTKALELDPKLYKAALFTGDAWFKQKKFEEAGEWYAKAIQIDPNIETAYRYWGDALMAAGRMAEARAKFIDAVVAEPYVNRPRMGLTQWAQHNRVQFRVLQLKGLAAVTGDGGNVTITIDPSTLGTKNSPLATAFGPVWCSTVIRTQPRTSHVK